MDEEDRDEDEEVGDEEDGNERVMDEDEAVEVPIYIKVHYNYTNEHTLYLSLMY